MPETLRSTYRQLIIDGNAGTPQVRFDGSDLSSLEHLSYDITTLAYRLPNLKRAAIIGLGGGRDVLAAKYFGVSEVVAIDVNGIQVDLLRNDPEARGYTGFDKLQNVSLVHDEARSWMSRNAEPFDIIQMSLVDTWAATTVGAFALTENGLYTVEGWRIILDDLSTGGVFTVSRWLDFEGTAQTGRILALAVATLLDRDVISPAAHIFLAGTHGAHRNVSTLVVSRDPLTGAQLDSLHAATERLDFNVLVSPRGNSENPALREIVAATTRGQLLDATRRDFLKLFPPTDAQPFFFNQAPLDRPVELWRLAHSGRGAIAGHAAASMNLLAVIAISLVAVTAIILLPLWRALGRVETPVLAAGSGYFFFIGLGFMLIEISMLQSMGLYLGHPSFGLAVVLFSLILFTGLGSLASSRVTLVSAARIGLWAAVTASYFLLLGLWMLDWFATLAELSMGSRAMLCALLTAPGGFLLGFGFPTGMALCEARSGRMTPWLWGVNGAAGVLGSAVALATNIIFGLDTTLILGALCYVALPIAALPLIRKPRTALPPMALVAVAPDSAT